MRALVELPAPVIHRCDRLMDMETWVTNEFRLQVDDAQPMLKPDLSGLSSGFLGFSLFFSGRASPTACGWLATATTNSNYPALLVHSKPC